MGLKNMTTVLKQIGEECFVKCKKLLIFQVNWMTAITSCELNSYQVNVERLLYNESLSAQNETIKVSFKNYIPLYDASLPSLTTGWSFLVLFHPAIRVRAFIKYYIAAFRPKTNFTTFILLSEFILNCYSIICVAVVKNISVNQC